MIRLAVIKEYIIKIIVLWKTIIKIHVRLLENIVITYYPYYHFIFCY